MEMKEIKLLLCQLFNKTLCNKLRYSSILLTTRIVVCTAPQTCNCNNIFCVRCRLVLDTYRLAQKQVSHYHESSLNRIKNRQWGYISRQFWAENEHKNVISVY